MQSPNFESLTQTFFFFSFSVAFFIEMQAPPPPPPPTKNKKKYIKNIYNNDYLLYTFKICFILLMFSFGNTKLNAVFLQNQISHHFCIIIIIF